MIRRLTWLVVAAALTLPASSRAQSLGTYSWQLAPYCNVVTVNVTQTGSTYTLDGYDTQCGGASNRAPATGMAVPNPTGTIGFGLTIVTSPGGTPVHVEAAISLATLSGTWRDSLGGTGDFVFTPAAAASGSPRPLAVAALPDGSITTPKLADGAVDASKIDPTAVQRRIQSGCPTGQMMTGVGQDGTVACEAVTSGAGGDITGVAAGTGLTGGGVTGDVTLSADLSQVQARVASACPANEAIRAINADGTVVCDVDNDSGGDVTAVTAGSGLTGGGTAGDLTLSVQFAGSGTANVAARSNHTHATTGPGNTSIGEEALGGAAGSASMTAVGYRALRNNISGQGTWNTAIGSEALSANTSGQANVGVGAYALQANLLGDFNTAVGTGALEDNTSGSRITAIGANALLFSTTSSDSTAVGYRAGAGAAPAMWRSAARRSAPPIRRFGIRPWARSRSSWPPTTTTRRSARARSTASSRDPTTSRSASRQVGS